MSETSTSCATDRNLKLHKCPDVSRAKITDTMAERHWHSHWHQHRHWQKGTGTGMKNESESDSPDLDSE